MEMNSLQSIDSFSAERQKHVKRRRHGFSTENDSGDCVVRWPGMEAQTPRVSYSLEIGVSLQRQYESNLKSFDKSQQETTPRVICIALQLSVLPRE
jgi:hypothetical protein